MKTSNIIKTLLMQRVYNPPAYVKLKEENEELMEEFNEDIQDRLGYKFNPSIIKEISFNLLLISHDTSEILEVIEAFNQLKPKPVNEDIDYEETMWKLR